MSILQSKRISDVTVSELCKKANINRNTFYAHFSAPEQVLEQIAAELQEDLYLTLGSTETSEQAVIAACEYIKAHATENIILLDNDSETQLVKRGIEKSINSQIYMINDKSAKLPREQLALVHEYIVSGTTAIMKKWLYSGMKESPAEIGRAVNVITSSLIDGLNAEI